MWHWDKLAFRRGDIKTVELPKNEFDLGIAVSVFLMVEGDEGFRNIYNSLKPGGLFYFEDYYLTKNREEMEEADSITARRLMLWQSYHEALESLEAEGRLRRPGIPEHCDVKSGS